MKKLIFSAFMAVLALCLPASAESAARTVPVQVDGVALEGKAYLDGGVTYAPLRDLLEAMGGWTVRWDGGTGTAVAESQCGTLRLTADPDRDTLTLNGETRPAAVTVLEGRTYVPLRLTAEALGGSAAWDPWMGGAAVTTAGAEHDAVDYYWLSRIIYAASGADSLEGQIAVGNVVLNRVESGDFPDSIPAVIFEGAGEDVVQFEPVANGMVYQAPSDQAMEAARRVLAGETTAGNSLYFYAPALSQGAWINASRTYELTIGCHRFYS